jgi:hypothetical protein
MAVYIKVGGLARVVLVNTVLLLPLAIPIVQRA